MCDSHGTDETCTCDSTARSGHEHSHDHAGHDHSSHDHAGQDHSSHDHAGQDHSSHDHSSHDQGKVQAPVTAEYGVEGMTCSHCVSSVTEELSQLDGVTNVDIDLVAGGVSRVTVASARTLDADAVAAAVDEAGYELADLPR